MTAAAEHGTGQPLAAEAGRRAEVRARWLLSAPALLVIVCGAVGPLAVMGVYSFLAPGPYGDVVWRFSTDAWVSVLLERDIFDGTLSLADAHLSIFWRSTWLALATTVLALLLGFPTAYFIATRPARTRDLWLLLVTIPFWTNLLIRTFAVLQIIRNEGVVNSLLLATGLVERPVQILFTDAAILTGMVYVYLPLMVLPLYASLERLDFRMVEAGYDLYARPRDVLLCVILPLAKPGIVAGSILVFIPALGAYVTPTILGGGKNMMLGNLIELQFGQGRNWPLGASLAISLMALVTAALLVYVRSTGGREAAHG